MATTIVDDQNPYHEITVSAGSVHYLDTAAVANPRRELSISRLPGSGGKTQIDETLDDHGGTVGDTLYWVAGNAVARSTNTLDRLDYTALRLSAVDADATFVIKLW